MMTGAGASRRAEYITSTRYWSSRTGWPSSGVLRTQLANATTSARRRQARPDTTKRLSNFEATAVHRSSDRRSVLAVRVLDLDLAVAERKEVATIHRHTPAVFLGAGEGPFRQTPVTHDDMAGVGPLRVGKGLEHSCI